MIQIKQEIRDEEKKVKDNLELFYVTERIEKIRNKLKHTDQQEIITRKKIKSMAEQMQIEMKKKKEMISMEIVEVKCKITDMVSMIKDSWGKTLVKLNKLVEKKKEKCLSRNKLKERQELREELKISSDKLVEEGKEAVESEGLKSMKEFASKLINSDFLKLL
jgi:dGTP triphosphohydrolase